MKALFSILLCSTFFWTCQNSAPNHTDYDGDIPITATEGEQKHCFIRLDGNQQQDSTHLQLVIRGVTVSGTYNYLPHEKDARRGTVLGSIDNDTLDLVWTYRQEGTQDTMRVLFLLDGEKLMRKSLTVDTLTGRQYTLQNSDFSEIYERIDCLK